MNEETEMTEEIVGGNVFEFTTEVANLVNSAGMELLSRCFECEALILELIVGNFWLQL